MSYELASHEVLQASSSSVLTDRGPEILERIVRAEGNGLMASDTVGYSAEGISGTSMGGSTRASKRKHEKYRKLSLKSLRLIPQKLSTADSSHDATPSTIRRIVTSVNTHKEPTPYSSTLPLPSDVILDVASLLAPSTLLNLILTSSAHRDLLLPSLYHTVTLSSSSHCLSALPFLLEHPTYCSYIHEIVLKPNYYLAWPRKDKFVDEAWVGEIVAKIASKGWLTNLEWFEWEGMEMPIDQMWGALRVNCPKLKNIATHVGKNMISSQSALFDFNDLTSFSLIARHNIGEVSNDVVDVFPNTPLPERLWDMILNRCPNLTELTICSFSPYTCSFNIAPLLLSTHSLSSPHSPTSSTFSASGFMTSTTSMTSTTNTTNTTTLFPKLTSLTLGSFRYQSDFTIPQDPTFQLGEFLSHHPSITYLRALWNFKRWMSPDDIPLLLSSPSPSPSPSISSLSAQPSQDSLRSSVPDLKSPTLPKLETFVGIYQQLAGIPLESRQKIEVVDMTCEPVYQLRADKVCQVLKTVEALKTLDVWVHVTGGGAENGRLFGKLVNACPGLEELHFMCTTPFGKKSLDQLLTHLSRLPSLRRFSLTKGHTYKGDESMLASAIRIFKACKGLKTVNVRWAREKCLNHLKQEGVYDVVQRIPQCDRGSSGAVQVTLSGNERGIPLIGRPFERSYKRRVTI